MASFDENIIFLGLSNSAMNEAAKKKGLRYANEVLQIVPIMMMAL